MPATPTKMTPAQQAAYFEAETQRVAALIGAALRDCWNWHVEQYLDGEQTQYQPPDVVRSQVAFAALADFGAKLVIKHTGNRIVFIKATGPLTGWLPETMMFMVPPEKIGSWKQTIVQELGETGQDLLSDWEEIQAQKAARDAEPKVVEHLGSVEDVSGIVLDPLDEDTPLGIVPRAGYVPSPPEIEETSGEDDA